MCADRYNLLHSESKKSWSKVQIHHFRVELSSIYGQSKNQMGPITDEDRIEKPSLFLGLIAIKCVDSFSAGLESCCRVLRCWSSLLTRKRPWLEWAKWRCTPFMLGRVWSAVTLIHNPITEKQPDWANWHSSWRFSIAHTVRSMETKDQPPI